MDTFLVRMNAGIIRIQNQICKGLNKQYKNRATREFVNELYHSQVSSQLLHATH